MTGHTHLVAGAVCGLVLANATNEPAAIMVPVAATAAIVPDIDCCTSKLGRKVLPVSFAVQLLFGHRTMFHGPLIYILAYAWAEAALPQYHYFILAAGLGIASHLLLDALNPSGIPLLWPVSWKFRFPITFQVGGLTDWLLTIAFAGYLAMNYIH